MYLRSRLQISLLCLGLAFTIGKTPALAAEKEAKPVSHINFLIPGGKGGGWDTTARETGQALLLTNLVDTVSFTNYSGAGGGRALIDFIKNPDKYQDSLMVQSLPLILRNLSGEVAYGFRDITPVNVLIAEYQAVAVLATSSIRSTDQLIQNIRRSPTQNTVIGGSSRRSLDHITISLLAREGGIPVEKVRYTASNGGGGAYMRLVQGQGVALVSGLGELYGHYKSGEIRLLGISSDNRLESLEEVPTFKEQGLEVVFSNWRGFFAPPGVTPHKSAQYQTVLKALRNTPTWKKVRDSHFWSDLYIADPDLSLFLKENEATLRDILQLLDAE